MSQLIYLSAADPEDTVSAILLTALEAWKFGVTASWMRSGWESFPEADIFLRVWTDSAAASETMRDEAAFVREMRAADEENWPKRFIDLCFTDARPAIELPNAEIVAAHGSRAEWLAQLARVLGIHITLERPSMVAPQLDVRLRWRLFLGNGLGAQTIDDGLLFVSSSQGLSAIKAANGQIQWHAPAITISRVGRALPPAVSGDTLYVACCGPTLSAVDRDNGAVRWSTSIEEGPPEEIQSVIQCTPAVTEKLVVVSASDGYTYAYDIATGIERWRRCTGPRGSSWASPVVDGDIVYVGSTSSSVFALNLQDGTIHWQRLTVGTIMDALTLERDDSRAAGTLYVAPLGETIYALNAADGSVRWEHSFAEAGGPCALTPLAGKLFGCLDWTTFTALRASDGEALWHIVPGGSIFAAPVTANGLIYLATSESLSAIAPEDGQIRWRYPFPGGNQRGLSSTPSYSDGYLYCTTPDGYLYALQLQPTSTT